MAQIDFNEIASSHNSLSALRGNRVSDAKLTQITLKAREVKWNPRIMTEERPIEGSHTRESSHSTDQDMMDTATVHIRHGLCTGLNAKVLLPYPGIEDGSHILDINPCDPNPQQKIDRTTVTLTSGNNSDFARNVDTVLVKKVYNGNFQCKVYPGGSILKEAQQGQETKYGQVKTQTAIQDLKDMNHSSVKHFVQDEGPDGKFYFKMTGLCQLSLDAQLQHNWN